MFLYICVHTVIFNYEKWNKCICPLSTRISLFLLATNPNDGIINMEQCHEKYINDGFF